MNQTKRQARLAGLLYFLASIPAPFGLIYVPNKLIVLNDATATANHIRASESLLRWGIACELFTSVMFIFVVVALYRLFKAVNETYALSMAILILISIPISLLSVVNEVVALIVLGGADWLSVFDPGQLNALAYILMRLHSRTLLVAGNLLGFMASSVRDSHYSITFYPQRLGLLAVCCSFGVCGQQSDLFTFAKLRPGRRYSRVEADIFRAADHPLAFDLGCKRSTRST